MEFARTPTAVVTGGGGANVGIAISATLADAGARVTILDADSESAEAVFDDIRDEGGCASFFECDVTNVA